MKDFTLHFLTSLMRDSFARRNRSKPSMLEECLVRCATDRESTYTEEPEVFSFASRLDVNCAEDLEVSNDPKQVSSWQLVTCGWCGKQFGNIPEVSQYHLTHQCIPKFSQPHEISYISKSGLPTNDAERKELQLWTFLIEYFPDAWLELVKVSVQGNKQHNPGEPLHWAKDKSTDQLNTAFRHLWDNGRGIDKDTDGMYHLAKAAWRILAELQLKIESKKGLEIG